MIVGPGNAYVAEAKRQVVGRSSAIDGSPARPRSRSSPTTPSIPRGSPPTSSRRPSTAPAARSTLDHVGRRRSPTASSSRSRRCSSRAPRARRGRSRRSRPAAASCSSTDREQAIDAANAIAPEHLELMCADAALLVPLVRNAGAVFVGADAPAVIGDYVAGRQPRAAHRVAPRGSPSALRVADFQKHIHVVLARRGRARARSRRSSRTLAEAEGLHRARRRGPPARGAVVTRRPTAASAARRPARARRLPLAAGRRAVRLNTNESPYPPPAEFVARWLDALRDVDVAPLSRPRRDRAARRARRVPRPAGRAAVLRATAATRCCRRCCSPTAAPGRRALMFEPTYALHAHIAAQHRHRGRRGRARRRLRDRRRRRGRARSSARSRRSCSCAARTTRRAPSSRATTVERLADARRRRRRAARRRRGLRRVRAVERARARRRRPPARRRAHVLEGVVAGRRCGSASRSRPTWVIAELEKVLLPYNLSVPTQVAGTVALDFRAEMEQRVASLVEERGRLFAALAATAGPRRVPVGRELPARSASTATPTTCGSGCSTAACSCATSRRGRGSRDACASRSARPPRTMHSSPRSTRSCRRS